MRPIWNPLNLVPRTTPQPLTTTLVATLPVALYVVTVRTIYLQQNITRQQRIDLFKN